MIPCQILGTAGFCPGPSVTTAQIVKRAGLSLDADRVVKKTGIVARHWDDEPAEERAASVGSKVLLDALGRANLAPSELRRLVFVSSTGGDFLIPATANALLDRAGIDGGCDGFDLNNACMGFLTGLDLAARTVATGLHPVAVVSVELLSRFIGPDDPRPYLVLGDAAGAAVLGPAQRDSSGVLAFAFENRGNRRRTVYLGHPGLTHRRELIAFGSSNRDISEGVVDVIEQSAARVLSEANLSLSDVDWLVPHQPNGSMLDAIVRRLGIAPDRVTRQVETVGSVGSASIAVGLDALFAEKAPRSGDRVLMVGAGAGISYGALLLEV